MPPSSGIRPALLRQISIARGPRPKNEIFGPDADPDELRAFYEAIELSMEYECNIKEMSVEIALKRATPTSKNEVGVAHRVRGGV